MDEWQRLRVANAGKILKYRGFPQRFKPGQLDDFQPVAFFQVRQVESLEKKGTRPRALPHPRYARPPHGASREEVKRWEAEKAPVKVGVREQEKALERLFTSIDKLVEEDPIVVGISGKNNDSVAFQCALNIGYRLFTLTTDDSVLVIDVGNPESSLKRMTGRDTKLVIMHNLSTLSSYRNIENAQNFLHRFQDLMRIVVIAGSNPLFYSLKYLQYEMHQTIYFG